MQNIFIKWVFKGKCLLLLFLLFAIVKRTKADTTYIKFGAVWKYLDRGIAAPAGWTNLVFNDAGWKSGPAELGYGAARERTKISFGADPAAKYITTYFRRTVSITDISFYSSIRLNTYIDDGAVIYVNGTEVARTNIKGKPGYTTLAAYADENGNTITGFDIPAGSFISGQNIIAVEVHQSAPNSSDLAFDLEMLARPANTPGTEAVTEPVVTRGPFLQMVSPDAITIRWSTATANTSRVKYGLTENSLNASIADRKSVIDHEMRITGLKPDTRYYYAIGSRFSIIKGSYRNYFTTSPPANTKRVIRIGVFGDPGTGTALQKSSRDNYLKMKGGYNNAEMIIMLGDNAYNAGTEGEHNLHFFDIYTNNIFDNHVIFPVPGNHEYANDKGRAVDHNIPYYSIFTVPANAESGGLASGTEHYYSYDYGNIHFIMLDSYGIDGGNHLYDDTSNGQQALWLKADLAANAGKHKWTIACMHHPPYTNGSHISDAEQDLIAIRRKITPILERYGVDLVLAGHSHVYERSFLVKDHIGFSESFNKGSLPGGSALSLSNARYDGSKGNKAAADTSASTGSCPYFIIDSVYKHGTVYVVAGSAGQVNGNTSNTYPVFYTRNQSNSNGGESGALYLEFQDNRLDAKFVGNSGTIRDQFTIMKGVNKKTILNLAVNKAVQLNASWPGSYNWTADNGSPMPAIINQRNLSLTPKTNGIFSYYVKDSAGPSNTCITDTFTLQVGPHATANLIKYDALLKDKKVLVQWTIAQENNSSYYAIERSVNGHDFETVMAMDATNNAATMRYSFTDNTIPATNTWYRLMLVGQNNDRTMLGLKMVNPGEVAGTP